MRKYLIALLVVATLTFIYSTSVIDKGYLTTDFNKIFVIMFFLSYFLIVLSIHALTEKYSRACFASSGLVSLSTFVAIFLNALFLSDTSIDSADFTIIGYIFTGTIFWSPIIGLPICFYRIYRKRKSKVCI